LIVGVTGHRDLGDAGPWVRAAIDSQLTSIADLVGLSGLAAGADQIFVESVSRAGGTYEAVIACTGYEATFDDEVSLTEYRRQLSAARAVHLLPYAKPVNEAFLAVGSWIVDRCELLVAVWNGLPARGIGGTGDVVALAVARHRRWIHVNPVERSVREVT